MKSVCLPTRSCVLPCCRWPTSHHIRRSLVDIRYLTTPNDNSASYALTASYALNGGSGGGTGSTVIIYDVLLNNLYDNVLLTYERKPEQLISITSDDYGTQADGTITISTEYHLFSDVHEYAGTADLIVKIDGKLWLLDIKTSNSLHTSYGLQLSAYAMAWNETHSDPIERTGVLWLKASTRTTGKEGKIQGKGWELKEYSKIAENFVMFKNIYEIYNHLSRRLLKHSSY